MAIIDPSTPAGVMPVGDTTGNYTLSFSDEFNTTTLDSKWTDYADWYKSPNSNINYDTNNGGNSLLRIWPPSNRTTSQFNNHSYLDDPDRILTTRNSFRQIGGYFECKLKACVGQGQWPAWWLYHESIHDEFDIWEPVVPGTIEDTGWGWTRSDGQLSPGNYGSNIYRGPDPVTQVSSLKYADATGVYQDYAERFFISAHKWDATAGTIQRYLWWFDDQNILRGGAYGSPVSWTRQNALFLLIDLAWGNSGGTVLDSLPKGPSNSFEIDWVRVWTIGGSGEPPPPPSDTAFTANLVSAPSNNATISGTVGFHIDGTNIRNAELLPGTPGVYLPVFGSFSLSTSAQDVVSTGPGPISAIPSLVVNLASFGGTTGASPSTLTNAFSQAFTQLRNNNGGSLVINGGLYNFGSRGSGSGPCIDASNLRNVHVAGSGSQFNISTNYAGTPIFIALNNPNNVLFSGLGFFDGGSDISTEWRGGVAFYVRTSGDCRGFKVVDCTATSIVNFCQMDQQDGNQYTLQNVDINVTLTDCYYGVNPRYNGNNSQCIINATRVRRAFLAFNSSGWKVKIVGTSSSGSLGSNGYCYLVSDTVTNFPCRDYTIRMDYSGNSNPYTALVVLGHQGNSDGATSLTNIKAHVNMNTVSGTAAIYRIFAEFQSGSTTGIVSSTGTRRWENIALSGTITGGYSGTKILNTTTSTTSPNSVYVRETFATGINFASYPSYVTNGGYTNGSLNWDTTTRPDDEIINLRISAFNTPPGSAGDEIVVMTRTYTIDNDPAVSSSEAPSSVLFCSTFLP